MNTIINGFPPPYVNLPRVRIIAKGSDGGGTISYLLGDEEPIVVYLDGSSVEEGMGREVRGVGL
jgi:hypothetical protein